MLMMKLYPLLTLLVVASLFVTVNATPIAWSPYLPIHLSDDTTIQTSQTLYFGSFVFGDSSLLLNNVYMGAGNSIYSLNVSSINANLTLNQLSSVGETSITASGSGLAPITLQGFGKAPDSVVTTWNMTVPYSYSSSNDILTLNPTITGSETILIIFNQTTTDIVLGVAVVALLFSIVGVALVLFIWTRKKGENDNN